MSSLEALPWTVGVRTIGPLGPTVYFHKADSWPRGPTVQSSTVQGPICLEPSNSSLLLTKLGIGVIWRRTMRRRSCELSEGKRLNLGDTSATHCEHCEAAYSFKKADDFQQYGTGFFRSTVWVGEVKTFL